jgi:prepilin-type N-terminal cleavage/methylation domain-containing protein
VLTVSPRREDGFTFIELLVSMAVGSLICLTAFGVIITTQANSNRITEQIHIDQTGRVALENLMHKLHSACVVAEKPPVQAGSTSTTMKFISVSTEKTAAVEPQLHEVTYNSSKDELTESIHEPNSGGTYGEWTFKSAAASTVKLASEIQRAENSEHQIVPVFRYYQYYQEEPATHTNPHPGELEPESNYLTSTEEKGLSTEQAENVAKVTVSFEAAPGRTHGTRPHDPTVLEDSAIYRLTPASTLEDVAPEPCG